MSLLLLLALVFIACFVISVALMWHAARRPMSDEDRACARVDVELDRREAEARMIRRLARQRAREASPIRGGGGWRRG